MPSEECGPGSASDVRTTEGPWAEGGAAHPGVFHEPLYGAEDAFEDAETETARSP